MHESRDAEWPRNCCTTITKEIQRVFNDDIFILLKELRAVGEYYTELGV